MKKMLALGLFLALFLTGCSSGPANEREEPIPDIAVWDVEPNYECDNIGILQDDIDGDKELSELFAAFNPPVFECDDLYRHYDKGGIVVMKSGFFGFMNVAGEITVNPVLRYASDATESCTNAKNQEYLLNPDYTLNKDLKVKPNPFIAYEVVDTGYYAANDGKISKYVWEEGSDAYDLYGQAVAEGLLEDGKHLAIMQYKDDFPSEGPEDLLLPDSFENGTYVIGKDTCKKVNIKHWFRVYGFSEGIMVFGNPKSFTSNGDILLVEARYPFINEGYYQNITYVNTDGEVIASDFEEGYPFYEGYAAVKKDGKWGFINARGEAATDFVFDKATPLCDGKAWVIYQGKVGRLNVLDMIQNNVPFTEKVLGGEE